MSVTTEQSREQLPAVVTTLPDDPDDRALAQAQAEAQRELPATDPPPPSAQPEPPPPAPPAPPAQQQREPMVPAGVLAEQRRRGKALEDENLYLKGALAARTQQAQPGAPGAQQQPRPPSIEDQIQAEGRIIIDASKRFDAGELSMEEFKAVEMPAQDRIAVLRSQHLLDHLQTVRPAGQVGIADAAVLDNHLQQLSARHPWSTVISGDEIKWLEAVARDEFRGRRQPIDANNPMDTMRLRERIAQLSDTFGPTWHPELIGQPYQSQPAPQQTPGNGTRAPSTQAQGNARLAEMAANQPPSVATAGFADAGEATLSPDKVANMSEDEILALPPTVRHRLLYGS